MHNKSEMLAPVPKSPQEPSVHSPGASDNTASTLTAALRQGVEDARQAAARQKDAFAVGLHDQQSGRSFGAVDRFAVDTLCWRAERDSLIFAETATELAGSKPEIDPQAIFEYLFFHCIPAPRTIFKGVGRIPAAHAVSMQDGAVSLQPYWRPDFTADRQSMSFENLRSEFLGLLKSAVARALDGSVPACFLSGGTDSSSVAGMIREVTGRGAESYSIGFDASGYDEMAYARLAAKRFGCNHHEYYVTPDDLVRSIPAVAAAFDQPFGNSSVLPSYYCSLKAREDGVTRLLAGDGGDELFGGNARYAKQRIFGVYQSVPEVLRSKVLEPFFGLKSVATLPLLRKGSSYIEQARVPMPDRLQMYNLLLRLGVDEVLTPDFVGRIDAEGPAKHQREVWDWSCNASDLNRTLAYDWRYTLGESDLPKVRGASALAGVTVGYPMLDQALLEFSMRLPDAYKLRGLKLRWFFKEALRGFLPDEIISKPKHGFGLPFGPWAIKHSALHRLAAESLGSLGTRGIVRPGFLKQLLDQRLIEHPGYFGEMVWILMMLEQWLQHHQPDARF
jgi:asparagine synthase (glutamine-hydrolysing)